VTKTESAAVSDSEASDEEIASTPTLGVQSDASPTLPVLVADAVALDSDSDSDSSDDDNAPCDYEALRMRKMEENKRYA
jgi:hypothetical protein